MLGMTVLSVLVTLILMQMCLSAEEKEWNHNPQGHYEDLLRRIQSLEERPRCSMEEVLRRMQSLEEKSERSEILNDELKTLNARIDDLTLIVNEQTRKINNQEQRIVIQDDIIEKQRKVLSEQKEEFEKTRGLFWNTLLKFGKTQEPRRHQFDAYGGSKYQNQTDKIHKDMDMETEVVDRKMEVVDTPSSLPRMRRNTDTVVAFHAYLISDMNGLAPGHIIRFERIKVNIGNDYHPNDGIFACRVAGYYMFHWRLMGELGHITFLALSIKGQIYARIYADTTDNRYDSDSEVAFAHLNAGDHVWVEAGGTATSVNGGYCSFFGVLLFKD